MSPTIYDAFKEAAVILGARNDSMGWIQFQFELDREFPKVPDYFADLTGGFGRHLALFMFAPESYEERREGILRAARRAMEVVENFRKANK